MGKLHELLAVEEDLKGKRDKIREETISTFSKKHAHFEGWIKRLEMYDESRAQEGGITEQQEVTTTVNDKINYMKEAFVQYWDAKLQKETANQLAKANIRIAGLDLSDLPVTFLLNMEKEIKQLRQIFDAIPTLAPGVEWKEDNIKGENIFKCITPLKTQKTQKKVIPLLLAEATKEHKAQVSTVTEERPIGDYILEKWSGALSPAQKSKYLGKIDELLIAFKKARQQANMQDTESKTIGEEIFKFIMA